jgi:hypothetical protein
MATLSRTLQEVEEELSEFNEIGDDFKAIVLQFASIVKAIESASRDLEFLKLNE